MSRKSNNPKFTQHQLVTYDPKIEFQKIQFQQPDIAERYIKRMFKIVDYYKANPCKDGSVELHHIIPVSWGGPDCSNNIVALPVRAHLIVHHLLAKTLDKSMVRAFCMLINSVQMTEFAYNLTINQLTDCIVLRNQILAEPVCALENEMRFDSIRSAARWIVRDYLKEDCSDILSYGDRVDIVAGCILKAIKRKRSAYDFHWMLQEDVTKPLCEHLVDYKHERQTQRAKADRRRIKTIINLNTQEKFDAVIDAASEYGVKRMSLADAARRGYRLAGCFWIYEDDLKAKGCTIEQELQSRLQQYDRSAEKNRARIQQMGKSNAMAIINLSTGQEYPSAAAAAEDVGVSAVTTRILEYDRLHYVYSAGCYWILKSNLTTSIEHELERQKKTHEQHLKQKNERGQRAVVCVSTRTRYKSVSAAMRASGVVRSNINAKINQYLKPVDSIWLYEDQFERLFDSDYDKCNAYYQNLQDIAQRRSEIAKQFFKYSITRQKDLSKVGIYCFNNKKTYSSILEAANDLNVAPFMVQQRSLSESPSEKDLWFVRSNRITPDTDIDQLWESIKASYNQRCAEASCRYKCVETGQLYNTLHEIAQDAGLTLDGLQSRLTNQEKINGLTYTVR